MLIPKKVVETVDAKFIHIHVKVCDSGTYELMDSEKKILARRDDYVPKFFPTEHYGDYIVFLVDLESGQIVNWKRPDPSDVALAFDLLKEGDDE